jgi:hypothetical protein
VDGLTETRRALHGVAELVLAGPQYRSTGEIWLRVCPGGFGTVEAPGIRVDGVDLLVADRRLPIDGHSCADLAAAAGLLAGAPRGLYHDGSGVDPAQPLSVDPEAARWLARCFAAADEALRQLAPDEVPILWPEHFDIGIRCEDTNYGGSPGDGYLGEPYAYVTPSNPRADDFWNAPFGAARPMRELDGGSPEGILAFFLEGRDRSR